MELLILNSMQQLPQQNDRRSHSKLKTRCSVVRHWDADEDGYALIRQVKNLGEARLIPCGFDGM